VEEVKQQKPNGLDDDITEGPTCIILEGLDGIGKSTTVKYATKILQERYPNEEILLECTPPVELTALRSVFDTKVSEEVRRSYYQLGNYLLGFKMKTSKAKVMIVDRFWPSTIAYQEATKVNELGSNYEPKESLFLWPKDLFHPKNVVIVLLVVDEETRLARINQRVSVPITQEEQELQKKHFRNLVLSMYRKVEGIVEIDASGSVSQVTERVLALIN